MPPVWISRSLTNLPLITLTVLGTLAGCGSSSPNDAANANSGKESNGAVGLRQGNNKFDFILSHDFGVIRPGQKVTHGFAVKNTTVSPWRVEGITRTCACAVVVPGKSEIAPGETATLPFELQGTSKPGNNGQSATIQFKGASNETILVNLRVVAQVRHELTIAPDELAFGQVATNTKNYGTIHIENYSNQPWETIQFPNLPTYLAMKNLEKIYESSVSLPRQGWKAEFQLDTVGMDIAFYQCTLNVKTAPTSMVNSIPVTLTVLDGVHVTPSVLNFGKIKSGDTGEAKLLVRINGKHQGAFSPNDVSMRCESGRPMEVEWSTPSKEVWILTVKITGSSPREELLEDTLTLRFPNGNADRRIAMSAWMTPR